jgi:hypothetical protein
LTTASSSEDDDRALQIQKAAEITSGGIEKFNFCLGRYIAISKIVRHLALRWKFIAALQNAVADPWSLLS